MTGESLNMQRPRKQEAFPSRGGGIPSRKGGREEVKWVPSLREYLLKNAPKHEMKAHSTDAMPALHVVQ